MERDALRLHSLDALRGLAALTVVFWHWQHFQLLGTPKLTWPPLGGSGDPTKEPFYQVLRAFYEQGLLAVDLFYIISGFIFFWLYQLNIAEKKLTITDFFVFRLSRLYPLHFAALVLVAILQFVFFKLSGQFFVYPSNNLLTFLLSLFFIQGGGGLAAFNGPEWSLTVELLMYIVFCGLARCRALGNPFVPTLIILFGIELHFVGIVLDNSITEYISRGLCGFFVGGLTLLLFHRMRNIEYDKIIILPLITMAATGWLAVIIDIYSGGKVEAIIIDRASILHSHYLLQLIVLYGLFPITVLSIALHEALYSARYQAIAWLGEISYSSYLIHFPLQLVFALTVTSGILNPDDVHSPIGMITYLVILIPLSLLVFRKFEVPIQNALRDKWAKSGFRLVCRSSSAALKS